MRYAGSTFITLGQKKKVHCCKNRRLRVGVQFSARSSNMHRFLQFAVFTANFETAFDTAKSKRNDNGLARSMDECVKRSAAAAKKIVFYRSKLRMRSAIAKHYGDNRASERLNKWSNSKLAVRRRKLRSYEGGRRLSQCCSLPPSAED